MRKDIAAERLYERVRSQSLSCLVNLSLPVSVRIANRRKLTQIFPNGIVSLSRCNYPRKDLRLTLCLSAKRADCLWYAYSLLTMAPRVG